jgi:ABC-type glycerol-3-phosphate transport system substrate-binding protein
VRTGGDQEIWGINAYGSFPLLLSLIWSQNGEVISKDAKKGLLTDPATREGIQLWADLILRHKIAPTPPSGGSVGLSITPNEIGLTGVAPGGAALGKGSDVGFTAVVIQGGPGGPPPDAALARGPASRQRLAMAINNSPVLPKLGPQPPTILAADVPKGKRQATYQTLSASLALTTKAADPKLALRAALALADQLLESPVAAVGYPVRKPDAGMLRRVQPALSDEDAQVMATALTYARGLPPEVVASLPRILASRLMDPIANGRASIEDAIRDASSALDDLLKS